HSGRLIAALLPAGSGSRGIDLTADAKLLSTVDNDGRAHVWRVLGDRIERAPGFDALESTANVYSVRFTPGGAWMLVEAASGYQVWNVAHRRMQGPLSGIGLTTVNDSGHVAFVDRRTYVIKAGDLDAKEHHEFRADKFVRALALSPDNRFLAVSDLGSIVWDLRSGERRMLPSPSGEIAENVAVAFSPDGHTLAAAD